MYPIGRYVGKIDTLAGASCLYFRFGKALSLQESHFDSQPRVFNGFCSLKMITQLGEHSHPCFNMPQTMTGETPNVEIDCQTVKTWRDSGRDFLLLDCREQQEVETVSISESTWLPMSELEDRQLELAPHRDRTIVVYCHLGGRSLQVATWLRRQGYTGALSMAGGIDAWATEIDTALSRY